MRVDKGSMQQYSMYSTCCLGNLFMKSQISALCWCCMKSQRLTEVIYYIYVNLMTLLMHAYTLKEALSVSFKCLPFHEKSILQQHKGA